MVEQGPLRILHLTAGSDAGGVSRYLLDLTAAMAARGCQIRIAGERGVWHDRFQGIEWIDLPLKGNVLALRRAADALRTRLAASPADVIHCHYRRATLVGRRVADALKIPLLYTVHQPGISLAWPRRMLTDWGDLTHVPSVEAARWVHEAGRVPEARIRLVHHGVDPARFPVVDAEQRAAARARFGLKDSQVVAAFVGRIDIPKNADWLLDVAVAAPDVMILIAGDGPDAPALRAEIARQRLQARIQMLGEAAPLEVYHAADALLIPSEREGFSLVCAEAMCAGIPVLRTRTGGAAAMVVEGETGRTVEIDRRAFVVAANLFLQDRAALADMGRKAAEHIRRNFTRAQQVERTLSVYEELSKPGFQKV